MCEVMHRNIPFGKLWEPEAIREHPLPAVPLLAEMLSALLRS